MTTIGELLGDKADEIARISVDIGDVHLLSMGKAEGITPKDGQKEKEKFFVVLGFNGDRSVIGGIVTNSRINHNLPSSITDYWMPITEQQCPFLKYNSYANCSVLKVVSISKFSVLTYRGKIEDDEVLEMIKNTVKESPYSNKQQLREFGLV